MATVSSPPITIRPYLVGDADAVAALIVKIQRQEFNIPITLEDQPDLIDIDGFYAKGCGGFWVALDGDALVGTIALLDINNHQAALRKMFVAENYRGSVIGVAKMLLNHLIGEARHKGVLEIYLGTTADFVAAHRFYEKHGFKQFSKTDLPPHFPILQVDSRFYQLTL